MARDCTSDRGYGGGGGGGGRSYGGGYGGSGESLFFVRSVENGMRALVR